jgi:hypothetical protein
MAMPPKSCFWLEGSMSVRRRLTLGAGWRDGEDEREMGGRWVQRISE